MGNKNIRIEKQTGRQIWQEEISLLPPLDINSSEDFNEDLGSNEPWVKFWGSGNPTNSIHSGLYWTILNIGYILSNQNPSKCLRKSLASHISMAITEVFPVSNVEEGPPELLPRLNYSSHPSRAPWAVRFGQALLLNVGKTTPSAPSPGLRQTWRLTGQNWVCP